MSSVLTIEANTSNPAKLWAIAEDVHEHIGDVVDPTDDCILDVMNRRIISVLKQVHLQDLKDVIKQWVPPAGVCYSVLDIPWNALVEAATTRHRIIKECTNANCKHWGMEMNQHQFQPIDDKHYLCCCGQTVEGKAVAIDLAFNVDKLADIVGRHQVKQAQNG